MAYRIISFDGGGIRGVVSARLLARLTEAVGPFADEVDLIAGNSVGSINAVSLACGLSGDQIVQLFERESHTIFDPARARRTGALRPKYRTESLKRALVNGLTREGVTNCETLRLGDLPKKLLVPAFQFDSANPVSLGKGPRRWKAKLFHNYEFDSDGSPNADSRALALDVILRSSAAPVLFPLYQGFADGGLVALNPSVCALAQAMNRFTGKANLSDIRLLSIGTGSGSTTYMTEQNSPWGYVSWGMQAGRRMSRFLDAFSDISDFQCAQLLGKNYARSSPPIPIDASLENPADIPRQIAAVDAYVETQAFSDLVEWVKTRWTED
jgi:patatin-like phospholipase/acyl hydrolase